MQNKSDFFLFIAETIQRLKSKSPLYMKVWAWINTIMILAGGIPWVLEELDIIVVGKTAMIITKIVTISALWGRFQNVLTILRPPVEVQTDGKVINVTEPEKLPFTAKKEAQAIEDAKPAAQ